MNEMRKIFPALNAALDEFQLNRYGFRSADMLCINDELKSKGEKGINFNYLY